MAFLNDILILARRCNAFRRLSARFYWETRFERNSKILESRELCDTFFTFFCLVARGSPYPNNTSYFFIVVFIRGMAETHSNVVYLVSMFSNETCPEKLTQRVVNR